MLSHVTKVIGHWSLVIGVCLLPSASCLSADSQDSEKALDKYDLPSPQYIIPAKGILTSGYGWRWGRMHKGIDIAAPTGTPIMAAAPGIVSFAGWNEGGYGNLVAVQHENGDLTRYAHNSQILVRQGQRVNQGDLIALMGSTGYSTGPHLHFELHLKGQGAVNPIAYLPKPVASHE